MGTMKYLRAGMPILAGILCSVAVASAQVGNQRDLTLEKAGELRCSLG